MGFFRKSTGIADGPINFKNRTFLEQFVNEFFDVTTTTCSSTYKKALGEVMVLPFSSDEASPICIEAQFIKFQ